MSEISGSFALLVFTSTLALLYSYANGLNDAANAVATVISTRVLSPLQAVLMAAALNLAGVLTGTIIAETLGRQGGSPLRDRAHCYRGRRDMFHLLLGEGGPFLA